MDFNKELELRMYGLVIYQLSPIQAGIQFQHSVTRYSRVHDSQIYRDWADNWQTSIILNGGTTNLNPYKLGTLNVSYQNFIDNNIICEAFYEPDLGDQMTSIAVIVDERVFDFKKYPDPEWIDLVDMVDYENVKNNWIENTLGGQKNYFLRTYLRTMPLWR